VNNFGGFITMQSRKHSAIEQILNTGSGFIIAILLWRFIVTPFLGVEVDWSKNITITILFTAVSLLRGYSWRRFMNWITVRRYKQMRGKL